MQNRLIFREIVTDSPELESVIGEAIGLQKKLLVDRQAVDTQRGFLVSAFSEPEFKSLVQAHGGVILAAYVSSMLVGYVLTTHIDEFTSLITGPRPIGTFERHPGRELGAPRFLYQIAVSPTQMGQGIGAALLKETQRVYPDLLADILTEPFRNEASLKFFKKHGFESVGTLTLKNYRTFGDLKTDVLRFCAKG